MAARRRGVRALERQAEVPGARAREPGFVPRRRLRLEDERQRVLAGLLEADPRRQDRVAELEGVLEQLEARAARDEIDLERTQFMTAFRIDLRAAKQKRNIDS